MPVWAGYAGKPISPEGLAQQNAYAKQQAREAVAQLNKAKEAIAQAKSQYEHYQGLIEGNSKLGDFLNDPLVNALIPMGDWQQIYRYPAPAGATPAIWINFGRSKGTTGVRQTLNEGGNAGG